MTVCAAGEDIDKEVDSLEEKLLQVLRPSLSTNKIEEDNWRRTRRFQTRVRCNNKAKEDGRFLSH